MVKKHYPFFIVFFVLSLDQLIKFWTKTNFHLGENIFNLGFIKLDFVENPGMAFGLSFGGLFSKYFLVFFRIITVFFIGKYIILLINKKANTTFVVLITFIFSGALGNILDNVFYGVVFDLGTTWDKTIEGWVGYSGISKAFNGGYAGFFQGCVVDMFHLEFYWPSWAPFGLNNTEVFPPVFNIADACISTSVFIIVFFNKRLVKKNDLDFSALFKIKKS